MDVLKRGIKQGQHFDLKHLVLLEEKNKALEVVIIFTRLKLSGLHITQLFILIQKSMVVKLASSLVYCISSVLTTAIFVQRFCFIQHAYILIHMCCIV